ncbi:hypothetical protein [Streptomyces sp. NPDC046805]|uniref:hypothetical protein n=1 Tax=Streptomyces sp. NPDC046805 TaxID=3155134 RepID=UPI0033DD5BAD
MSTDVLNRRSARGATAPRGGALRRPTPYQVYGLLFWLLMTLAYWRVPPCCDAGQHASVVERLRAGLPDAAFHSPYVLAQAAFARLTGLSGWAVLRVWGPLNLLVLLTGVGRFVRALTPRAWAPVLALAFLTVLWGTERVWGGGLIALMPMTGNLGYPSACAIGLAFWAWALTAARARDVRPVRYVGPSGLRGCTGYAALGLLYGTVVLVDPVTGAGAALGAVACVAGWQRGWRAAVAGRWALAGAVAVLVAAGRPYAGWSVVAQGGVPEDLAARCWLALLGLPALWLRARRDSWRDPLVLLTVLECLAPACGRLGGLLGLALAGPQCALAVELAAPRPWPVWRRALGWAAAGGACLGFLTVQAGAVVPRSLDPVGFAQPPRWPSYDWMAGYVRPGDVVLADGSRAVRTLPGYGVTVADARAYLSPASTRAERTAIVRRDRVRWLLLTRHSGVPEEAVVVAWSRRTGEVLARVGGTGSATR